MEKKENKVNFDLSVLNLSELITLSTNIREFLQFLEDKEIIEEEKGVK